MIPFGLRKLIDRIAYIPNFPNIINYGKTIEKNQEENLGHSTQNVNSTIILPILKTTACANLFVCLVCIDKTQGMHSQSEYQSLEGASVEKRPETKWDGALSSQHVPYLCQIAQQVPKRRAYPGSSVSSLRQCSFFQTNFGLIPMGSETSHLEICKIRGLLS